MTIRMTKLNARPLVKSKPVVYRRQMSLKKHLAFAALLGCGAQFALADTIQLKDAAAHRQNSRGKIRRARRGPGLHRAGHSAHRRHRRHGRGHDRLPPWPPRRLRPDNFIPPTTRSSAARDVSSLVKQIGEAVVQVRTPGGLGSGFFINDDGYLITNFHVIEGETEISVEVYQQKDGQLDRETYKQVKIIAINKFHDLALLHIEDKNAPKFKPVTLGSSDALNVGDGVFAIGSPLGLERTVTQGILSTKTRQLEGELYLQTSTQINPGNSGGPLFNLAGEVVGVTNMKITFGEGLGFAIPVELVKSFLDHRDAFAYSTDNPNNPFRYLEPPSRTKAKAPDAK